MTLPQNCPLRYRRKVELPVSCPCYNQNDCNAYVFCDHHECLCRDGCNKNAKECDILNE